MKILKCRTVEAVRERERERESHNLNNVVVGVPDDPQLEHINKIKSNVVGADDPVCPFIRKHNKPTSNVAITLIALIITIIILLILSAVSLNFILGDSRNNKKSTISKRKNKPSTRNRRRKLKQYTKYFRKL